MLADIEHNKSVVKTLEYWRGGILTIDVRLLPRMEEEVWQHVRGRATQLLPQELTGTLSDYYSPLHKVLTLRERQTDVKKLEISTDVIITALAKRAGEQTSSAPILYVDYALLALQGQDPVHERVEYYLALPWWKRYPWTSRATELVLRRRRSAADEDTA